jgi:hypothetical protein
METEYGFIQHEAMAMRQRVKTRNEMQKRQTGGKNIHADGKTYSEKCLAHQHQRQSGHTIKRCGCTAFQTIASQIY